MRQALQSKSMTARKVATDGTADAHSSLRNEIRIQLSESDGACKGFHMHVCVCVYKHARL